MAEGRPQMDLRDGLVRYDKQLTSSLACWDLAQASHAGSSELLKALELMGGAGKELEKSWRRAVLWRKRSWKTSAGRADGHPSDRSWT